MELVHLFLSVHKFYCVSCDCEFTYYINKHGQGEYYNTGGGPSPSCKPSHMTSWQLSQVHYTVVCICSDILWLSKKKKKSLGHFSYYPKDVQIHTIIFVVIQDFKLKKKRILSCNIIVQWKLNTCSGSEALPWSKGTVGGVVQCFPPLQPEPLWGIPKARKSSVGKPPY